MSFEYKVIRDTLVVNKVTVDGEGKLVETPIRLDEFTPSVEKHLNEGWELVGGVSPTINNENVVMQAMKRKKR